MARSTSKNAFAIDGAAPLSSFSASSACSEPIRPAPGPSTPASAHDGESAGAVGNAQR